MDVFSDLSRKTKLAIVASTLFLLTLSASVLMFGGGMHMEEELLHHAREATRTDMLYSHPEYAPETEHFDEESWNQDVIMD
jgi:hypothetical protein